MDMIPSHIWESHNYSKGESQIFQLLEVINISKDCAAVHTLTVHGGSKQRWHELDFLLISNAAIFGLEVKAGRVSRLTVIGTC